MTYKITITGINYVNSDAVLSEIEFLVIRARPWCRVLDGDMSTRILTSSYLNEFIINTLNRIKECDTIINIEF